MHILLIGDFKDVPLFFLKDLERYAKRINNVLYLVPLNTEYSVFKNLEEFETTRLICLTDFYDSLFTKQFTVDELIWKIRRNLNIHIKNLCILINSHNSENLLSEDILKKLTFSAINKDSKVIKPVKLDYFKYNLPFNIN